MHSAGCAQEMPSRAVTGPALSGCRSRHLPPSQRMASGWENGDLPFSNQPAATQVLWPGQDRPVRSLTDVPGLGLGTTVHLVPFHVSVRLTSFAGTAVSIRFWPTARQMFGVEQETLLSTVSLEWVPGPGRIRQVFPFQASASGCRAPLVRKSPTATHRSGCGQLMPLSSLSPGLGILSTRHLTPSQATASAPPGPAGLA